ncbi:MAG: hypothetical protein LPK06_06630, partial [Marinobacter sp.]|nr:hypothetical protein [Marinobacter sp.]
SERNRHKQFWITLIPEISEANSKGWMSSSGQAFQNGAEPRMAKPKRPMDGLERVLESLPRTAHTTNVRAETVAGEIT